MKPQLTLIAAMDEERLIATSQGIPWHLPRDVAHFREYTSHKWLLMGRRTYGQMLGWFQDGHMPLVLTRRTDWKPERGSAVATIEEALQLTADAGKDELVCCGGGEVYAAALPKADRLILTLIQHSFPAETGAVHFPAWNAEDWEVKDETTFDANAQNAWALRIVDLRRKL